MTILVPPTILEKEATILHLPMGTHRMQEFVRCHAAGIEAGEKIACVGRNEGAVGFGYIAVNAEQHGATGKAELLANVIGIVEIEPQTASFNVTTFFSRLSAAGCFS